MKTASSNKYHVFFGNLANPIKIDIISVLKDKEMSVNELVKKLKIEQSNLSHALADLRECNLVTFRRKGKERIYSLNTRTLVPILRLIDIHAKSYCKGNCAYCTRE